VNTTGLSASISAGSSALRLSGVERHPGRPRHRVRSQRLSHEAAQLIMSREGRGPITTAFVITKAWRQVAQRTAAGVWVPASTETTRGGYREQLPRRHAECRTVGRWSRRSAFAFLHDVHREVAIFGGSPSRAERRTARPGLARLFGNPSKAASGTSTAQMVCGRGFLASEIARTTPAMCGRPHSPWRPNRAILAIWPSEAARWRY